jgi:hypothetical protein
VSGASDVFVVPDGDSGVEILHGSMEVLFGGSCYNVIVVRSRRWQDCLSCRPDGRGRCSV